jgi:TatD DNase family protein
MLIDAHAHLDRYEDILPSALEEITRHRIFTISNSMDLPSYRRNLEISQTCAFVLPTFGVHPWNAHQYVDRLEELGEAVEQSPMLGEIGLDYYFVDDASRYPAQRRVLAFFLAAAQAQEKIVILHTKGAESDVLDLLRRYNIQRAIVHWYSGPLDVFRELVARGTYLTIGVEVLYSEHIQALARALPAEQLLTETDNPGGPRGFIGALGMPLLIKDVVQALAELRASTPSAIEQTVQANFMRLIRDDARLSKTYEFFQEQHNSTGAMLPNEG